MMNKEDFSFREKKGPYDWEWCPYGASARILIKRDEDGDLMGKCELAERVWIQENNKSSLAAFRPGKAMKKDGCPLPPKWSWGKRIIRCKYNTGEYEYV